MVLALLLVIGPKRTQKSAILTICTVALFFISRLVVILNDPSDFNLPYNLNLIVGIPILIIGILVGFLAEMQIGFYSFSGTAKGKPLFTSGIYSKIRHPIYLCEILWPFGLLLIMERFYSIFITITCTIFLIIYIFLEERNLLQVYGEEYISYKNKVSMILPWKALRLKKKLFE